MPQISLYVDNDTMEALRMAARNEGVSMSHYTAELIRHQSRLSKWPQGYWENVYGSLDDDTYTIDGEMLDPTLDDACSWFGDDDVSS